MKRSARAVRTDHYPVIAGEEVFSSLQKTLVQYQKRKSPMFLLTDPQVAGLCLPVLQERCQAIRDVTMLLVDPGEEHKSLLTAGNLWKEMAGHDADRHSLLINLGGGMISDLGGFTASGFHRGIDTLHIPTTLVGQIDASVGGKTAINLDRVKNQVGTFYAPSGVFIWPGFLQTLPPEQLRAGLAEVAKTALIRDAKFWNWLSLHPIPGILSVPADNPFWLRLIQRTLRIKLEIVGHDPFERRQRKLLNFGHTFGHAFESLALRKQVPLLHGEAVAAGMVCETALSAAQIGLPESDKQAIMHWIQTGFDPISFSRNDEEELLSLMRRDKKNTGTGIRFTLLSQAGQGRINQTCSEQIIRETFRQYAST